MEKSIQKTFVMGIPDADNNLIMVTGEVSAIDPEIPINGWGKHLVYDLTFTAEKLPAGLEIEPGESLKFLIGPDEDIRIGRAENNFFIEISMLDSDVPTFLSYLKAQIFEILLLNPDKGHWDQLGSSIFPK